MMGDLAARRAIIDMALAMNGSSLNQGTSGNISVRQQDGFLITPSALAYEECTPEDIVVVQMSGEWTGSRKPSSEWRMHRDIFQAKPEAGAVLHAHPVWCTTLACLNRPIPAFHYMVAVAGCNCIPIAPYALFGTQQLSENMLEALENSSACLLENHGLICYGADLSGVLSLAQEIENLAQMYVQALQVGTPNILSEEQMDEVLIKFKGYRP